MYFDVRAGLLEANISVILSKDREKQIARTGFPIILLKFESGTSWLQVQSVANLPNRSALNKLGHIIYIRMSVFV
jgi:hypothetical protein